MDVAERPIGQALRSALLAMTPVAALLLVPAGLIPGGSWLWPRGLAFIGAYGAVQIVGNIALAIYRPAHFRVRQQGVVAARGKGQPLIDAVGSAALLAFGAAWLVFIPLDVFRLHLLPAPSPWISIAGGLTAVLGAALTPIAVWENRFATPNVQDQTGAGQHIVDNRRPTAWCATRSIWAICCCPPARPCGSGAMRRSSASAWVLLATMARIWLEERQLRTQFPEYADYARRVRGGLIPFVI